MSGDLPGTTASSSPIIEGMNSECGAERLNVMQRRWELGEGK
jgi:hypothetical protein